MQRLYSIFLLMLCCQSMMAQHQPRINQLYLNPFAYNPAYLGDGGYVEVSLSHRRQWVGLQGAPTTSWLTLQVPTDHRVALGLNIIDDRYGPLATTSALATFGYSVPFSDVSYLRFGLAAGIGTRRTDLSQFDDPDDPLVSTASDQRSYLDGSFGMHYRYNNFNVGVAVPRLFNHGLISQNEQLEVQLSKFDHFIAQAGYKIKFPLSEWALHPQAIYHLNGQIRQVEGLLVASYKDWVWGGASYRQSDTWAGSVGFKLYRQVKVGYAYELANQQLAFGATHELTLHWQFGRRREINKPGNADSKRKARQIKTYLAQKPEPQPKPKPNLASPEPVTPEPEANERVERVVGSDNPDDITPGHYVVVGTFNSEENAQKWEREIKQQGYTAQYGYSSTRNHYYVYTEKLSSLSAALQKTSALQKNSGTKDAWVLIVE